MFPISASRSDRGLQVRVCIGMFTNSVCTEITAGVAGSLQEFVDPLLLQPSRSFKTPNRWSAMHLRAIWVAVRYQELVHIFLCAHQGGRMSEGVCILVCGVMVARASLCTVSSTAFSRCVRFDTSVLSLREDLVKWCGVWCSCVRATLTREEETSKDRTDWHISLSHVPIARR